MTVRSRLEHVGDGTAGEVAAEEEAPPTILRVEHALALGAVQGPAEVLPVSSSGHLVLVPALLGWDYRRLDPELRKSFEVAAHAGAAAALLIGLRREVAAHLHSFGARDAAALALSFAPAAACAAVFERAIEQRLDRPEAVAVALIAGSVTMVAADRQPQLRRRADATLADALAVGVAQAFALVPGVSRNGATLTAARWRRFRRSDANVISREVALPVIVGAAALKGARLAGRPLAPSVARGMATGAGAAFAATLASVRLIAMLERSRSLAPYAAYRTALALVALTVIRRRRAAAGAAADRQRPADALALAPRVQ